MTSPASRGSESTVSRAIHYTTITVALIFLGIAGLWAVLWGRPASLQLHPNAFAILSIISFVSNVFALTLISRIKVRTTSLLWFSLHLLSLAAWAAAECMVRLSATPEAAAFWGPTTTLGALIMPISLYMFVLSYTDSRRAQQPLVFLTLLSVSIFLMFCDFRTAILTDYSAADMTPSPWGFVSRTGPLYLIITLWLVIISASALLLLYRFRRRTIEPNLRRQAQLFMIAITIPLIGGGITDGLLPGLNVVIFPPLSVTLLTIMGLIISYGIIRYRFFTFTPARIAGQILDTMNEAVIGVRPDFRISYVNVGAERLLGLPAAELARRHLSDFIADHRSAPHFKRDVLAALAGSNFGTVDSMDFRTAKDDLISAKLSITNVNDQDQSSDGYLIVLTDITAIARATAIIERRVAEQTATIRETKARLVSSINSLEFGFVMTDARPEVVTFNDTAHQVFCGRHDHSTDTCPVITLERIQAEFGPEALITQTIRDCLKFRHPLSLKSVNFQHRVWRIFVSPIIDGHSATGTAVLIQDITEEQILARSRDEFFSIASHELRTPLTAIKGNTSMMLQYFPDAFKDPSLHEMVNDILGSSERLIGIVNDFLDASRLEQGRFTYQLEPVKLSEAAENIAYELGATLKQKQLYLRLGEGLKQVSLPPVLADRNRLKQILYNLTGNASKFTQTGGITIDAGVAGDMIKITVTDTGRGMSPEAQALLFHKFQQATDSILTRDDTKGTGLGLYISRLLAQGMHGSLSLERSAPGKGSVFALVLPIATPARLKEYSSHPDTSTDAHTGLTKSA